MVCLAENTFDLIDTECTATCVICAILQVYYPYMFVSNLLFRGQFEEILAVKSYSGRIKEVSKELKEFCQILR